MSKLWLSTVKTVLLLFRPFCICPCSRCPNQKLSSQGAPCNTHNLGTVPQHHPFAILVETIASISYPQICKITLRIYFEGCRSSGLFGFPDHNSGEFYLIIHSYQTTKLSKALAVTFLIWPAFLQKVTQSQTHFSLWHISKIGSYAKSYVILWQKVENMFVEMSPPFQVTRFEFQAPQTLSSRILFPFIFVFLYQNWENYFSSSLKLW